MFASPQEVALGLHHHHHHHHNCRDHDSSALAAGSSSSRIRVAFVLNLLFTVVEVVGGLWTGSVAVLADAVHDLGDSLSLGLALYLQHRSEGGPNREFTYGYKRLSLLSALISGLVLVAGSVWVVQEALARLWAEEAELHTQGMLALAILGLVVNGVAAWRLASGRTHNERMLSWHLIEDVLGWAAVLVGALVISWTGWAWLDAVLAIAIAGFVAWNAVRGLLQTLLVFLQKVPAELDTEALRAKILALPSVVGVHDLHVWTLDGEHHVISLHLVVSEIKGLSELKNSVRAIAKEFGGFHTTIEVEGPEEVCVENCDPA